ncbi:hypothetical protein [Priestia megaterium]|uniref:hypothetical protein n=1 Tax=Priestia megaterium TaxID=1404 RepID=UPI0021C0B489|nr:hypothetical protein [Priestia megaterium]
MSVGVSFLWGHVANVGSVTSLRKNQMKLISSGTVTDGNGRHDHTLLGVMVLIVKDVSLSIES